MRKLISMLKENGIDFSSIQNLSNKFRNQTIRFNEIETILDYLGYKLEIVEKDK